GRGPEVRAEDLCSALVWRIATMTDAPFAEPEPFEPDLEPAPPSEPMEVAERTTSIARIVALHEAALDYYSSLAARSWVPGYLRQRLGTDLSDDSRYAVGYAPPGPESLIRHLTDRGVTIEELIEAGLASETERGRLVDSFRDRMVFPLYSGAVVVGFIGRRNPTKDTHEYTGPKYLNTRATAAFTKGEQLFGLHEATANLEAGATPVLVEGPMDAIAIALAGDGAYVGIAPLGTAFTESQTAKLHDFFREKPERIIIATDPDAAGRESARKAFWRLAALRANPQHLPMPEGVDPADILRAEGMSGLAKRLAESTNLAETLISTLVEQRLAEHDDAFARVDLAREAAHIVGAIPPEQWTQWALDLAARLDVSLPTVAEAVFEAGAWWTDDPHASAARELAMLRPRRPAGTRTQRSTPAGTTGHEFTNASVDLNPPLDRRIDR
ncbi:MAG: toprim domain-containing protein, partial [Nocardioides sp.]|uniref:toprim domain-containing protein n=1 Tax=Nocardioides sp. TaxID=35761 RepID=UPI0032649C01